jgi:putative transposase
MLEASEDVECPTHAYVLMPNYVYILCTPLLVDSVPRLMQGVGRRYVHYFNYMHHRSGALWDGRYRDLC